MKKYAVYTNKGGVGKSTVTVQLAHGMAKLGYRTIIIDLDGQNDSSLFLGVTKDKYNKTMNDILDNRLVTNLNEVIINVRKNLDLIPSSNIKAINELLHQESRIDLVFNKKLKLLENMGYDFIFVDCGAQKSKINDAVLCYVDKLIIPVQVETASVRAVGNIYDYLNDLCLDHNMVALVIPNMYDQRLNDSNENLDFLKELFKDSNLLSEPIHRRVKITEAGKNGLSVFEYDDEAANQFFKVLERLVNLVG